MKALTISQPYAELIAAGTKFVENRKWRTHYRGPLAIHAGKGCQYLKRADLNQYTTGAIVATAELITCIELGSITDENRNELAAHKFTVDQVLNHQYCEGPFAWVLSEIRRCSEPYYINGKQGLWEFDLSAAVHSLAW